MDRTCFGYIAKLTPGFDAKVQAGASGGFPQESGKGGECSSTGGFYSKKGGKFAKKASLTRFSPLRRRNAVLLRE